MAHALQLIYNNVFNQVTQVYLKTFVKSYAVYGRDPAQLKDSLNNYYAVIKQTREKAFQTASAGINAYLNLYKIDTKSPDEYKAIFHLGMSFELELAARGLKDLAKVHLYTMVGLLDFRLRKSGIFKAHLLKAMTNLIRQDSFRDELGKNGCYLIYKCVSTTPQHMKKEAPSSNTTK